MVVSSRGGILRSGSGRKSRLPAPRTHAMEVGEHGGRSLEDVGSGSYRVAITRVVDHSEAYGGLCHCRIYCTRCS